MNCLNCSKETNNPKFCSRSCGISYNNRSTPKRKTVEKFCFDCGASVGFVPVSKIRLACKQCKPNFYKKDWSKVFKGDVDRSSIRSNARKTYREDGRPLKCLICGYDTYVDIAHVKDIKDYPDKTPISIINSPMNLIALCKNHHLEFDRGLLNEFISDLKIYSYHKRNEEILITFIQT